MRITNLLALMAVAAMAPAALATPITLVESTNGAASIGNGALFSDPTGVAAPAAVGLNGVGALNTNGNGRALVGQNQNDIINFDDLADITGNLGVGISGWSQHRWDYRGGNDAGGFLEAGGRLGQPNEANNGQAFANSSAFILVSDPLSDVSLGNAADTFELSVQAGTDTGGGSFPFETFLVLDDTTFLSIDDRVVNSAVETINLAGSIGADYSTIRLVFASDAQNGVRSLIDNVNFSVAPVPEPNAVALSLLALSGFGAVGMRSRVG